jgi:hypothetical protein
METDNDPKPIKSAELMTIDGALNAFNNLILQCMANGAIKSFSDLDALRGAHAFLSDECKKIPQAK